jgi:two-component system, LuxR family, sensor histidine kinase DctS
VPLPGGLGMELLDVCVPIRDRGGLTGYMIASYYLQGLLSETVDAADSKGHELAFVEGDGTRLARAGGIDRGQGVFVAQRIIDLPGASLQLRADSATGAPELIPNLATALVLGLSLALAAVVALLARDVRRRAEAERGLAEALAFRKAMEDSLVTGLRARDMEGRITYVNPAFCEMVGFAADELVGTMTAQEPPPYWPPEMVAEYTRRQQVRLAGNVPIGARLVFAVDSPADFHVAALLVGQRLVRVEVDAPGPAVVIVDRHPHVTPQRVLAERRDQREPREQPLRDAPVI